MLRDKNCEQTKLENVVGKHLWITNVETKFAALAICQALHKDYEDDGAKQVALSQRKALFGDSGLHPGLMMLLG